MTGYPIAWTERWTSFDPSAEGSPYSATEVEAYLVDCHWHYSPKEEPLTISSTQFLMSRMCTTRRFWLWQVYDDLKREWFVVVGSGASPFFGAKGNVDRWIYAQTSEGISAEHFLDR